MLCVESSTDSPAAEQAFLVNAVGYLMRVNLTRKELSFRQRWCNTVCARCLGGMRQHHTLTILHRQYHLWHVFERRNGAFQYGNNQTEQAMVSKQYAVLCERYIPRLYQQIGGEIHLPSVFKPRCDGWLGTPT